jgi:hypothetical protein
MIFTISLTFSGIVLRSPLLDVGFGGQLIAPSSVDHAFDHREQVDKFAGAWLTMLGTPRVAGFIGNSAAGTTRLG